MQSEKLIGTSRHLQREFHADVFRLGAAPPPAWVLMFGGSGISQDDYLSRRASVVPIFDEQLARLESEGLGLGFIFVTAPWDISFNDIANDVGVAATWGAHIRDGILAPLEVEHFYGCGYSGGGRALPAGHPPRRALLRRPAPGRRPCAGVARARRFLGDTLLAIYNQQDGVYAPNRAALTALAEADVVRVLRQKPGSTPLPTTSPTAHGPASCEGRRPAAGEGPATGPNAPRSGPNRWTRRRGATLYVSR